MDWFQCNNCGIKPKETKMYFCACGHVFCRSCISKDRLCLLCKKEIKAQEINKNMKMEILEMFKDPRQVATDLLAELKQVVTFQAKQREIYMKFKTIETKRDVESLTEAKNRQIQAIQEMERRKVALSEENERLKAAKERKRKLTEELRVMEANRRRNSCHAYSVQTEPPPSKIARFLAPSSLSLLDQSTSKIVTSTPIANIDFSRRDYLSRMFTAGQDHPSPIPRL